MAEISMYAPACARTVVGFLCAVALMCAGCSGGSDAPPPAVTQPAANPKPVKPAEDPLAALPRAVVVAPSDAPVELTYDIQGKPLAGSTVNLRLIFTPTADAESLSAEIAVPAPLSTDGELKPVFSGAKVGQVNEQRFAAAVPAAAAIGIHVINVEVTLTRNGMDSKKSFAIPLVVMPAEPGGGEKTRANG